MNDAAEDLKAGLVGAGAGLVATAAMSGLMVAALKAGWMSELPPHDIADDSIQRTELRDDVGPKGRDALGWGLHFAFGGVAGAMFAVMRRRLPMPGPDAAGGSLFAMGVWAVSYLGWVPALRFLPHATRDEPGRPPAMIAAHLLFGAILGQLLATARPGDRS